MPRAKSRSRSRSRSRDKSRAKSQMNYNTRRSTRNRGLSVTEKRKIQANKEMKQEEERREALELKRIKKRYAKTPHLLSATLNRNKALKNLPGLLQKFTISKSTKSRKSPKNPFMVNRTKPFSMNSLLNEITKLNKT